MEAADRSPGSTAPSPADPAAEHQRGLVAAVAAHAIWGLIPLYLHLLVTVPALQIMVHRLVWCCVVVVAWLAMRGRLGPVRTALRTPALRRQLALSAVLISINWLAFTWAVTHDHVIEASLGYFINPLLNVALGMLFLGERLTAMRRVAVLLAAVAVLYLTVAQGRLPWIALVLGLSFSFYGLIRKLLPVEAIEGLAAETVLLAPIGAAYLVWCELAGDGLAGSGAGGGTLLLLAAGGLITAVPLSLFAYGARRIPYSTIGLIQYIGPSVQILLGIFVFGEPFVRAQAVSYGLIWLALALYAADGLRRPRDAAA